LVKRHPDLQVAVCYRRLSFFGSGRRDSNPRPLAWKAAYSLSGAGAARIDDVHRNTDGTVESIIIHQATVDEEDYRSHTSRVNNKRRN
jgi:hypothetical protein